MADKKISELTKLSSSDLDHRNDVIPIVDISSNTTKKIAPSGMPISGFAGAGTAATKNVGIGNTNVLQANAAVSDDDFLKVDGTSVEGRSVAEVKSDLSLGNVHSLNTGIGNNNVLVSRGNLADLDFIRVTGSHLSGRSFSEVRTDLGLGNGYALNTGIANTNILVANNAVADNDFLKIDGVNVEGRTAAQVRADLSLNNDVVTGSKDTLKERLNLQQSAYNIVVTGSNVYAGNLGKTRFGNGSDPAVNQISIETNRSISEMVSGSGVINIGSNDVRAFDGNKAIATNRYGLQDGHRLFRKGRVTTLQIGNTSNVLDTNGHGAYNAATTGGMIIGKRITISGYPIASFNRTDYQVVAQTGGNGTLTLTGTASDYAALADATGVNKSNGAGVGGATSNNFAVFVHYDAPPVSIGHKNIIGGECSTVIGQRNEIAQSSTNAPSETFAPKSVCIGSENRITVSAQTSSAYYGPLCPANLTIVGHGNGGSMGSYGGDAAFTVLGSNNFMGAGNHSKKMAVGSFNTFGNNNNQSTVYPGGTMIGHGNRSDLYCGQSFIVGEGNFGNSYTPVIFGRNNKTFAGSSNLLMGHENVAAAGPLNALIGHSNTMGANISRSIAIGRNVKLGGESTLQGSNAKGGANVAEVGWWNTADDPRARVRLDGVGKMVSMTIRDSSSAPVTGGAHHGSEPSGALGANMFTIQRNADAVTLFCNLGTGIKSIALGSLNA